MNFQGLEIPAPTRKHGGSTRSPTMQGPGNHHRQEEAFGKWAGMGADRRPLGCSSGGWHCACLPPHPPPGAVWLGQPYFLAGTS